MSDWNALTKYRLCYLATPYSKYPRGIHHAFVDASEYAAGLLKKGVRVYSPIAHTHPLAIYGNVDPFDHSIWIPFDETMMELADACLVAEMSGWKESKGVAHEIAFFERAQKPVIYLPGNLFM